MFDIICPPKASNPYPYYPKVYGGKVGDKCPLCRNALVHHAAISVCNCKIFTHRKCFLNFFPGYNAEELMGLKEVQIYHQDHDNSETVEKNNNEVR